MANLIITIIGIALIAVAAIMGIYYGGVAFENAQINATANTIISEAQQILQAERVWAVNHGQTDATGATMVTLVNDGEISYPTGSLAQLGATIPTTVPQYDYGVTILGGGPGCGTYEAFVRMGFTYNSGNYVVYSVGGNCRAFFPIAAAINSALGVTAASTPSTLTYTSYYGLYGIPSNSAGANISGNVWFPFGGNPCQINVDSSGNMISNMCYMSSGGIINCVFGPS